MTAEVVRDFQPRKLSALFFALSWFPLIALHELGHAVVARAFGHHVHDIVVGFGRPMWRFTVFGLDVELRSLPIEGFVTHSGPSTGFRSALISFAGPAAELLLAGLLLLALGPGRMFSESNSVAVIATQSVAVACVLSAIVNLIPHHVVRDRVSGETTANDGMAIFRALRG